MSDLNQNTKESNQDDNIIPLAGEIKSQAKINPTSETTEEINNTKDLPESVKASLKIDRKNYAEQQKPLVVDLPPEVEKKTKKKNILINTLFKILFAPFFLFFIFVILLIIFYLTNIDTKFVKITLYGTVTDQIHSTPIKGAKVNVNNINSTTDSDGNYSIQGLDPGKNDVAITADGYDTLNVSVSVSRILLDYTTKQNFNMTASQYADISGKLVATSGYNFLNDKLTINDKQLNIDTDGTFTLVHYKVGTINLKFVSTNFKTILQTVVLQPGINQIDPITLIAASTIQGILKSYVKEDLVINTQFYIENILQTQVIINQDGTFQINDLNPDKVYRVKVVATGYQTREYSITVKAGVNTLPDFRLVENTPAIFNGVDKASGNKEFYSSDLDGLNLKMLTNETNLSQSLEYLNNIENNIYFLSQKDSFSNANNGQIAVPYTYNISSNTLTLLLKDTNEIGKLYPNFISKKMVNIYKYSSTTTQANAEKIELRDLTGDNIVAIDNADNLDVKTARVSDDGSTVIYYKTSPNPGLYRFDLSTKQSTLISSNDGIIISDLTTNGKKILFQYVNPTTGFNDLILYDSAGSSTITLKQNLDGANYQFFKSDNNKVYYYSFRNGNFNIYKLTLDQNKDESVTNLTPDYQISTIYQQSNYIYYLTNKGLYVLDPSKPLGFKLVTTADSGFTGYNYL